VRNFYSLMNNPSRKYAQAFGYTVPGDL